MLEALPNEGLPPEEVHRLLLDLGEDVVRNALKGIRLAQGADRAAFVDEVFSELALTMLTGGFRGYDPDRSEFTSYLARAARNRALDLLRREGRQPVGLLDATQVVGEAPWTDPVDANATTEIVAAVREGLRTLRRVDPMGADILIATYLDGTAYPDLAARLGEPDVRTLHRKAHRARRKLGEILDQSLTAA